MHLKRPYLSPDPGDNSCSSYSSIPTKRDAQMGNDFADTQPISEALTKKDSGLGIPFCVEGEECPQRGEAGHRR